jgi:hypothetical protein
VAAALPLPFEPLHRANGADFLTLPQPSPCDPINVKALYYYCYSVLYWVVDRLNPPVFDPLMPALGKKVLVFTNAHSYMYGLSMEIIDRTSQRL